MTVHRSQVMYDGSATGSMAYGPSVFAGGMLSIVGAFQVLQGITAVVIAFDALVVWGLCTQMARSGSSDRR